METIFAVSSGQPPAAIAIIRISGLQAQTAGKALAGTLPPPRRAGLRRLHDPLTGELLDEAIVLFFPGPGSATGEDLVELHVHGGRAVTAALLAALARIDGLRAAEPGEFTRRALMHGRMDLTEAEGLGDLLMAETQAQRRAAQQASEGGLRRQIEEWTKQLVAASAQVEALIDYSDEGDVEARAVAEVVAPIETLAAAMAVALAQPRVDRLRDGIRVVLAGPPNAGKSTLLNALVQREAAIVSAAPGTTRDRIEASIVREGIAWLLTDTAGLRDAEDAVEREGIARADAAMREADIVIWLGDDAPPVDALWVHARSDEEDRRKMPAERSLKLSARTGEGIDALWAVLGSMAQALLPALDRPSFNTRQAALLQDAAECLNRAVDARDLLVLAEELRLARFALDRITGRADVEGVLDALFGRFCIGK